jgi:UDP-glucose 4-epimerase
MVEESRFEAAVGGRAVLVTGGAGFIGSHLARRLVELGAAVRVIDDLSTGRADNLPLDSVQFIEASILDGLALRRAVDGCRFVFHQAAMVSVPRSVEEPLKCAEINVTGTERILEAARDAGAQRVVFASSAAVYGDRPNLPSREDDSIVCCSPYAASKAAGEALMTAFARCYGLSTVSLRYFNIFGPRQDLRSSYAAAIAAFAEALMAGRRPTIFGDGRQTRDFTPVANVVRGNLLAAASGSDLRGEVVNIGTGRAINLLEVLAEMERHLGVKASYHCSPPRAGDVRDSAADIARARAVLGYEPQVDFATGLAELLDAGR